MSLASLCASRGLSVAAVARALPTPVDPQLFARVDNGRQPLPADVAEQLAAYLGVDLGTVQSEARTITPLRGPRLRVPLPPDPLRGDEFVIQPLGRTVEAPLHSPEIPPTVTIWTVGLQFDADPAMLDTIDAKVNVLLRKSTAILDTMTLTDVTARTSAIAFDGTYVWVFRDGASHAYDPSTYAEVLTASDAGFVEPTRAVYDPTLGVLWVACGDATVVQVDRTTGAIASTATLNDGTHDFVAHDIVAVNGLLYVSAVYHLNTSGEEGRVFRLDDGGNIEAVSTGSNLGAVWGLDVDVVNGVILVSSEDNTQGGPGLFTASTDDLDFSPLTPTDSSALGFTQARWVKRVDGVWFLSGIDATLYSMRDDGLLLGARELSSSSGVFAGPVMVDENGWLWTVDRTRGLMLLHLSATLDIALTVGGIGAPENLVLVSVA